MTKHQASALDRTALGAQFRALGVRSEDVMMLHASLRKVGPIDGGAQTLIHALIDVVGPRGTIVMALGADEDVAFDALTTPVDVADMGVLAEVFRTFPGVRVNDHAAARFAALGFAAADLLEPVPLHDYHGRGSVLHRFVDWKGRVLRLGADDDTVTLTHYAEYLAGVPGARRVRRRYVRADTGEQWIESLDDNDGIVEWAGGDYFSQILLDYRASGAVQRSPVGQCSAELFDATDFVGFAVRWMNEQL
jgi:aminoglycoside N3'-acetyltransferase